MNYLGSSPGGSTKFMWSVYIVRCSDSTLYCGISNNVAKRVSCHNSGRGAKYTKTRRPVNLVYTEECGTRSSALKREYVIKKMSRKQKLSLCALVAQLVEARPS